MRAHTFISESVVQAVEQIRTELGPQAVVLNVRRLPVGGLTRIWRKPRIEVVACVPDESQPSAADGSEMAGLPREIAPAEERLRTTDPVENGRSEFPSPQPSLKGEGEPLPAPESEALPGEPAASEFEPAAGATIPVGSTAGQDGSPLALLLASSGLLPAHVQRVLDEVQTQSGGRSPESLGQELASARAALVRLWRAPAPASSNFHVFIGPPGVGKTTVLCKWLAQAVLVNAQRARVWRLDGAVANTAESLSVFAEILGAPVERSQPENDPGDPSELTLVDLPGVNSKDSAALKDLARRLRAFPGAQVHLVLNAAYEGGLLLAQGRAFQALPVDDVILTHLDEEPRWGKLWNFVLGTNYTVASLSAGQNVPGDYQPADPERILFRHFPQN